MVEQIRSFDLARKYFNRIVYIDPTLSKSFTPTINPLECRLKTPRELDIQTNQIVRALEEMLPDAKLSLTMRAIIKPCIYTLLSLHTCTLEDLQAFLGDTAQTLLERGKISPVSTYRQFFNNERNKPMYKRTKQSIYTKIQSLLNSQVFYNMTIGRSTVNIER